MTKKEWEKFIWDNTCEEDRKAIIKARAKGKYIKNVMEHARHGIPTGYPFSLKEVFSWDRTPEGIAFWREIKKH